MQTPTQQHDVRDARTLACIVIRVPADVGRVMVPGTQLTGDVVIAVLNRAKREPSLAAHAADLVALSLFVRQWDVASFSDIKSVDVLDVVTVNGVPCARCRLRTFMTTPASTLHTHEGLVGFPGITTFNRLAGGVTSDMSLQQFLHLLRQQAEHKPHKDETLRSISEWRSEGVARAREHMSGMLTSASAPERAKSFVASDMAFADVVRATQYRLGVTLTAGQLDTVAWAVDMERHSKLMDFACVRQYRRHDGDAAPPFSIVEIHNSSMVRFMSSPPGWRRGSVDCTAGCIFDDMGLGKTIEMLALMLTQGPRSPGDDEGTVVDVGMDDSDDDDESHAQQPDTFDANGGTLIVVPVSLVAQWEAELQSKVVGAPLRLCVYHGPRRERQHASLQTADVVLATYETVSADIRGANADLETYTNERASWACPGELSLRPYKARPQAPSRNDVIVSVTHAGKHRVYKLYLVTEVVGTSTSGNRHTVDMVKVHFAQANHKEWYVKDLMNDDDVSGAYVPLVVQGSQRTLCFSPSDTGVVVVGTGIRCREAHAAGSGFVCSTCRFHGRTAALEAQRQLGVVQAPLQRVRWTRIVADESHKLQDPSTAACKAMCELTARHKWCLTGTPMPRSVHNLDGQLRFLTCAEAGIRPGSTLSSAHSTAYLPMVAVRHEKATTTTTTTPDVAGGGAPPPPPAFLDLPPLTSVLVSGRLPEQEQEVYDAAHRAHCARLSGHVAADRSGLLIHTLLQQERQLSTVRRHLHNKAPSYDVATNATATTQTDECPVCFELMQFAVTWPCRHTFCAECSQVLLEEKSASGGEYAACCLCKQGVSPRAAVALKRACKHAIKQQQGIDNLDEVCADETSTAGTTSTAATAMEMTTTPADEDMCVATWKYDALIRMYAEERHSPVLVFTHFTSSVAALRVLFAARNPGIPVTCFSGAMTRAQRVAALAQFHGRPDGVLLMLIRAAAVGLNLTHAHRVVFLDPALNSGLERQAVSRVHRAGQAAPLVQVYHFITQGTVEERVHKYRDSAAAPRERALLMFGGVHEKQ